MALMEVTVHEAKTQISRLLKLAEEGETVSIMRCGIPVACLTPVPRPAAPQLGWDTGPVAGSVLRPMTDDEAETFLRGA
jgi:antitoxin (DNA-binding transcriptional repressor) of toxin-antitoxin stability system